MPNFLEGLATVLAGAMKGRVDAQRYGLEAERQAFGDALQLAQLRETMQAGELDRALAQAAERRAQEEFGWWRETRLTPQQQAQLETETIVGRERRLGQVALETGLEGVRALERYVEGLGPVGPPTANLPPLGPPQMGPEGPVRPAAAGAVAAPASGLPAALPAFQPTYTMQAGVPGLTLTPTTPQQQIEYASAVEELNQKRAMWDWYKEHEWPARLEALKTEKAQNRAKELTANLEATLSEATASIYRGDPEGLGRLALAKFDAEFARLYHMATHGGEEPATRVVQVQDVTPRLDALKRLEFGPREQRYITLDTPARLMEAEASLANATANLLRVKAGKLPVLTTPDSERTAFNTARRRIADYVGDVRRKRATKFSVLTSELDTLVQQMPTSMADPEMYKALAVQLNEAARVAYEYDKALVNVPAFLVPLKEITELEKAGRPWHWGEPGGGVAPLVPSPAQPGRQYDSMGY